MQIINQFIQLHISDQDQAPFYERERNSRAKMYFCNSGFQREFPDMKGSAAP